MTSGALSVDPSRTGVARRGGEAAFGAGLVLADLAEVKFLTRPAPMGPTTVARALEAAALGLGGPARQFSTRGA
jgi:hypothetical protein